MIIRLIPHLKLAIAHALLITAVTLAAVAEAQCQELFLFREPDPVTVVGNTAPGREQAVSLTFSGDGGLLIRIGTTSIALSYNPPMLRFKPSEQQNTPRSDQPAPMNGICLTASLTF
jgi:hypothetical protein